MTTHVVRLQASSTAREPLRTLLDPRRTWLMVAIAGTVLAASLLLTSLAAVDRGAEASAGSVRPEPGPAPTRTAP